MSDKILLVDDDQTFRQEFKSALEEYDVLEAGNGPDAISILKRPHEIELVLLDVRMPGSSGTEVLREVKILEPKMPVIILTGYSTKDTIMDALRGQADDYLEKPIVAEKAIEMIERLLEKKRGDDDLDSMDTKGKIERVKRFIERNCFKKISLDDAAGVVCMSSKYFSRVFKQNTGTSFSRYKLRLKINKAQELLKTTGYNINQIADRLGFENASSFMRMFKKLTGITPTDYRESGRPSAKKPKTKPAPKPKKKTRAKKK